jgi:hypothetical protein
MTINNNTIGTCTADNSLLNIAANSAPEFKFRQAEITSTCAATRRFDEMMASASRMKDAAVVAGTTAAGVATATNDGLLTAAAALGAGIYTAMGPNSKKSPTIG